MEKKMIAVVGAALMAGGIALAALAAAVQCTMIRPPHT
jgi:hypothetical protein